MTAAAMKALVLHQHGGLDELRVVDDHRAAMPGDLIARGRIVKWGSQYAVSEATVSAEDDTLVASGRGVYFTVPPKG